MCIRERYRSKLFLRYYGVCRNPDFGVSRVLGETPTYRESMLEFFGSHDFSYYSGHLGDTAVYIWVASHNTFLRWSFSVREGRVVVGSEIRLLNGAHTWSNFPPWSDTSQRCAINRQVAVIDLLATRVFLNPWNSVFFRVFSVFPTIRWGRKVDNYHLKNDPRTSWIARAGRTKKMGRTLIASHVLLWRKQARLQFYAL